ncbi:hypothetical protein [uncultured Planktomarina sp.]|jgi:hypothetical protein|uniref:hypothetical protein n=1 Tax=uncultured Planktomarina sp. TaxID=1538529 RepID=UPI003261B67B
MWIRAICAAALALQVSVAAAEMSVDQQAAFAVLTPLAQDQLAADSSQKIIDLANEIIQRPLALTCLNEKLS